MMVGGKKDKKGTLEHVKEKAKEVKEKVEEGKFNLFIIERRGLL